MFLVIAWQSSLLPNKAQKTSACFNLVQVFNAISDPLKQGDEIVSDLTHTPQPRDIIFNTI